MGLYQAFTSLASRGDISFSSYAVSVCLLAVLKTREKYSVS